MSKTQELPSIDEALLADFERKFAADLREIETLKADLGDRQAAFKARYERVLAALERA
jgi:hypothetical protein